MKFRRCHFGIALILALILPHTLGAAAAKKPVTAAELALYSGADRQQILEEGAKREGKLTLYTTAIVTQTVRPIVDAFQKKYPYIKVEFWRAGTTEMFPRLRQEFEAGRPVADVVETAQAGGVMMQEAGMLQPFYSPQLAFIEEGAVSKAPGGAYTAALWRTGISLGYNTKLIKKEEIPKTNQDLLDLKWKGKIAIVGSNTGITWVGALLETYGEGFVEKVARQKIAVHQVSARALLDMIIGGEYAMSPTIRDAHINKSKQDGAPVDWLALEPVPASIGQIMMPLRVPHPHAALLFIDFDLSRQSGNIYVASGYDSPRRDIKVARDYKKHYGPWTTAQERKWAAVFQKYFLNQ